MTNAVHSLAVIAGMTLLGTIPALADRAPTGEERKAIEKVLTDQGFTAWESIELEDAGHWEVDDAIAKDGKKFDLRLKDKTYEITDRKAD
ncbi:MAG: PepSY domain-containing protein [Methylobacterium sp.]|uniref:PepSY domain-containing protein n=1 Tax=Methylobacterium sp. TaxID=409 RepID=UPI0025F4BCE5|nr:PepSY domain-containing protein [Methylobacterium sp.]MBX9930317.1 PepSY domain-containing protein [Methylobacterium sp.]